MTAFAGSLLLYGVLRAPQTVALQLLAYVLYGVVALLVLLPGVFGDRLGGRARGVLRHRLLAWVGLVSYAVYLYHTVVIAQVNKLLSDIDLPLRYPLVLLLAALITCACAAASYYLLERPIMRLRFSRRARREDRDRPSRA